MTPEARIFAIASEIADPARRRSYLESACADDEDLRRRVDALFQELAEAESYFAAAGLEGPDESPFQPFEPVGERALEGPGTVIGRYRLMERLGEGGMGVVYRAEQKQPVAREVALKIIKLGMDTRQVVARFEAERQALALMDHPNIARVLDAGTTDSGRPYFVMDLVRGMAITEFCDEHRLTPKERLELLVPVCQAIQHAHQKGIIHRDIKPSNVLVTLVDGHPHPSVIDFGVAKAIRQRLTEKTVFTLQGQILGTPAYMSPEQADPARADVDTRTDVYSLGVLLYELLTGSTPFPTSDLLRLGYSDIQRVISEEEPPRPSARLSSLAAAERTRVEQGRQSPTAALVRMVRGDLDWVVMKCLEKDPGRRYATANGLAIDLLRNLANEPVSACPAGTLYRLGKAVRRHRVGFAAAGAVALALVAGLVGTSWQALRARTAERDQIRLRGLAEEATERMRQQTYAAEMRIAQVALESGHADRCRELLLKWRPEPGSPASNDLRGIEWRWLWHASRSGGDSRIIVDGGPGQAVVSPDGRFLAVDRKRSVSIRDAKTLRVLHEEATYPSENAAGTALGFSPDGAWVVFSNTNGVRVLSVGDWVLRHELPGGFFQIAFSPDVALGAVAGPEGAYLWSCSDTNVRPVMRPLRMAGGAPLRLDNPAMAFAPDHRRIFVGLSRGVIQGFDTESRLPAGPAFDMTYSQRLAVSHDGRLLAGGNWPGYLAVWSLEDGSQLLRERAGPSYIGAVVFSPDDQVMLTGSTEQKVKLWRVPSPGDRSAGPQKPIREFLASASGIGFAQFLKGRIQACSAEPSVDSWDLTEDAAIRGDFRLPEAVSIATAHPLGRSGDGHRYWAFLNERFFACWDFPTGGDVTETRQPPPNFGPGAGDTMEAFLSRSSWHSGELIYCDKEGVVSRFNPESGSCSRLFQATDPFMAVNAVVEVDGKAILLSSTNDASGGVYRTRPVELETGRPATGPWAEFRTHSAALEDAYSWNYEESADHRWCVQEEDGHALAIWDLERHLPVARVEAGFFVFGRAFSPDRRLLAACPQDGHIAIWDIASGRKQTVPMTAGNVSNRQVRFSRDGRTLVALGDDMTTRLLSVATGQEMLVWTDIASTEFSSTEDKSEGLTLVWRESTAFAGRTLLSYLPFPSLAEIDLELTRDASTRGDTR